MLNIKKNKGFSLAEMMVVMLLLSIIFAAAAPILTKRVIPKSENVVGDIPVGSIMSYSANVAPAGWLICNGSSYSKTQYPKLFSSIGTTYGGSGDTFKVPDLRGRTTIGSGVYTDSSSGVSQTVNFGFATIGGERAHLLSSAEMPAHVHTGTTGNNVNSSSTSSSSYGLTPTSGSGLEMKSTSSTLSSGTWTCVYANSSSKTYDYPTSLSCPSSITVKKYIGNSVITRDVTYSLTGSSFNGSLRFNLSPLSNLSSSDHYHTFTTAATGNDSAHNNLAPYMSLNYIIKY